MEQPKGFAVSWLFAPYSGSADMDFYKRIKNSNYSFDVVQVARAHKDERVLRSATTQINRFEIKLDYKHSRSAETRQQFKTEAFKRFKQNRADYSFLISHSNEMQSHDVAAEIKKIAPKLPWIAYFGDLFVKNPYVKYIHGYPLIKEDEATERATLAKADIIIVNNAYQKKLMFSGDLEKYIHKCVIVPHCYDPALYPASTEPAAPNDRYVFAHLGILYHTKRMADPVLRAVDRLIEIYPEYKNKFEIIFYGGNPTSHDISVHAFLSNRNHVRFEDAISYTDSLKVMQQADCLLLIDGIFNQQDDDLQFSPFLPGKLMDYMGANKPIAAITMQEGPTADILKASGNLCADEKTDRIAYVLKRYIDGKVKPDFDHYAQYSIEKISKQMDQAISSAIKGA